MVFGGIELDRLQLNETSLWSGGPREWNNADGPSVLPKVRAAIFAGQYRDADRLCRQMQGPYNESYMPMADLRTVFPAGHARATDYSRRLDLDRAVVTVGYRIGDVAFTRETFANHPDNVIVSRLSASKPGQITVAIELSTPLKQLSVEAAVANAIAFIDLKGEAPSHTQANYPASVKEPVVYSGEGMMFHTRVEVRVAGGSARVRGVTIEVENADEVVLIVAASTSFAAYDKSPAREGVDATAAVMKTMDAARSLGFEQLMSRHQGDYRAMYDRVHLDLGTDAEVEGATIPERLARFQQGGEDPGLATLLFQFGRYLLISSSRNGGQPANLQGIWNDEILPPWCSNWTININTQMNYWLAEPTNLSECARPLFGMIAGLAANGGKTARINYNMPGWVSHHNADLWRQTAPVGNYGSGNPVWANYAMSGPWLCQHLWEHYAFTQDREFLLDRAYPIMKGSAEFCLAWLVEDPSHPGKLVTAPSCSPELSFVAPDGSTGVVTKGATMDLQIIHDLLTNTIDAAKVLDVDAAFVDQMQSTRDRLLPLQIGHRGNIQEWADDLIETEEHHRHVSHLFGLHPGRMITPDQKALFAAARKTLEIRGDDGTGWSLAWKINFWARLLDGDHAYRLIQRLLRPVGSSQTAFDGGGVYPNLFDAHPPFQIDGNFGFTAGVTEMLLQSQNPAEPDGAVSGNYILHLLPALPAAWPTGSITGLRARGGIAVDLQWRNGNLFEARFTGDAARTVHLRFGDRSATLELSAGKPQTFKP
jgi:alpha-L-fucosidase 2